MKHIALIHVNGTTLIDQDVLQKHCTHQRTGVMTIGDQYIYGGDLIDTRREVLYCLDCGAILDEPEPTDEIPF